MTVLFIEKIHLSRVKRFFILQISSIYDTLIAKVESIKSLRINISEVKTNINEFRKFISSFKVKFTNVKKLKHPWWSDAKLRDRSKKLHTTILRNRKIKTNNVKNECSFHWRSRSHHCTVSDSKGSHRRENKYARGIETG